MHSRNFFYVPLLLLAALVSYVYCNPIYANAPIPPSQGALYGNDAAVAMPPRQGRQGGPYDNDSIPPSQRGPFGLMTLEIRPKEAKMY